MARNSRPSLDPLRGLQRRLLAGPVGVQREDNRRREPLELVRLLVGQGRAHQPHGALHAGLVHRDHVDVALAEHGEALARRGGARKVGREEVAALVVELAVGAVEVLGALFGLGSARAEAEHPAASVAQREGDPRAEAIVEPVGTLARALRERRRARSSSALNPPRRDASDTRSQAAGA